MGYLEDSLTLKVHLPVRNFYCFVMKIVGIYTASVTSIGLAITLLPLSVCSDSNREAHGSISNKSEDKKCNTSLSIWRDKLQNQKIQVSES